MKTIAICLALLVLATAETSSFNGPDFIDAGLQGVLGWAYPKNFQTCKNVLMPLVHQYVAFWESFENFSYGSLQAQGETFLSMYMASPRCQFGTSIV